MSDLDVLVGNTICPHMHILSLKFVFQTLLDEIDKVSAELIGVFGTSIRNDNVDDRGERNPTRRFLSLLGWIHLQALCWIDSETAQDAHDATHCW